VLKVSDYAVFGGIEVEVNDTITQVIPVLNLMPFKPFLE
jgi:hypothetical protein